MCVRPRFSTSNKSNIKIDHFFPRVFSSPHMCVLASGKILHFNFFFLCILQNSYSGKKNFRNIFFSIPLQIHIPFVYLEGNESSYPLLSEFIFINIIIPKNRSGPARTEIRVVAGGPRCKAHPFRFPCIYPFLYLTFACICLLS